MLDDGVAALLCGLLDVAVPIRLDVAVGLGVALPCLLAVSLGFDGLFDVGIAAGSWLDDRGRSVACRPVRVAVGVLGLFGVALLFVE